MDSTANGDSTHNGGKFKRSQNGSGETAWSGNGSHQPVAAPLGVAVVGRLRTAWTRLREGRAGGVPPLPDGGTRRTRRPRRRRRRRSGALWGLWSGIGAGIAATLGSDLDIRYFIAGYEDIG